MMETKSFPIHNIHQQIDRCVLDIKFHKVLKTLSEMYTFKVENQIIEKFMYFEEMDCLAVASYKSVLLKLAVDLIRQKMQQVLNINEKQTLKKAIKSLNQVSQKIGIKVKDAYESLMKKIQIQKSQIIQFAIFLVFLSVLPVLNSLTSSYQAISDFFAARILEQSSCLQVWACIIINYHITAMKISPQVYEYLKKKYIKEILKKKKKSINMASKDFHPDSISKIGQHNTNRRKHRHKHSILHKQIKIQHGNNQILNQQNLTFQLDNIFPGENHNTVNLAPITTAPKKIEKVQNYFFEEQQKLFHKHKNKHRTELFGNNKNVINTDDELAKHAKNKKNEEKKQSTCSNYKKGVNGIGFKENTKHWVQKIRGIRNTTNIQRVSLSCKKGKNVNDPINQLIDKYSRPQEDFQRMYTNLRHRETQRRGKTGTFSENSSMIIEPNYKKSLKHTKGFSQFIDIRQSEQIGIVKSIVNYTCYSPEKKYRKVKGKQLKKQYGNLLNLIQKHANQSTFNERMQMAISGK